VRFATDAIEAYRTIGDNVAAVAATARFGKVLIDESEIQRATEVLEAVVPEAEAVGDEPVLATALAYLARAHMRGGRSARAVEIADRALTIGERLNLEPIIAEALVNKGSALNILGRRREAAALEDAALTLARRIGDATLEIRIINNLAATVLTDEPLRGMEMYLEARDVTREVGDRGMYNWLSGLIALNTLSLGGDLDEQIAILNEALEAATLRPDRLRLRMIRGVLESQRGINLAELRAEIAELVGDSSDPEQLFHLHMSRAIAGQFGGDQDVAYVEAMAAFELTPQNPDIPLINALRGAINMRHLERASTAAAHLEALGQSGELDRSALLQARAAVAALSGRPTEALAALREARDIEASHGQRFEAAVVAANAVHLLPGEPEARGWAEEARPLLVEMRVAPWIEMLDTALAAAPAAAATAVAADAHVPAQG
jgi:tetratricopeptide (TPR) repeat protein